MKESICKICNKKFKSNAGLGRHIKVFHNMTSQEYYDSYIDPKHNNKYCNICGKQNKYKNLIKGYTLGCCTEHTNLLKYGVENPFQAEEFIKKIKQTKIEKYGDENYNNRNKALNTTLELYGVNNVSQIPEVKEKIQQTNLENLGVKMPFMSKDIQEKVLNTKEIKYNNKYYTNRDKYYNTMKQKGFISKEEKAFEKILLENNIKYIPQYYDKNKYPFYCDFYLIDLDIFIELNIFPAHGPHRFNKNNSEDIKLLNLWKKKSKSNPIYLNWIKRWTITDQNKISIANLNKLNYFTLYNNEEINLFIKDTLNIKNIIFENYL